MSTKPKRKVINCNLPLSHSDQAIDEYEAILRDFSPSEDLKRLRQKLIDKIRFVETFNDKYRKAQ